MTADSTHLRSLVCFRLQTMAYIGDVKPRDAD